MSRIPALALVLLSGVFGHAPTYAEDEGDQGEHGDSEAHHDEETEEIVVQATRSGRRVQDEPIRVEVLVREEIEEKLLMRPGNIAMLVNETGGVRVQVTSPALGAAKHSNPRVERPIYATAR